MAEAILFGGYFYLSEGMGYLSRYHEGGGCPPAMGLSSPPRHPLRTDIKSRSELAFTPCVTYDDQRGVTYDDHVGNFCYVASLFRACIGQSVLQSAPAQPAALHFVQRALRAGRLRVVQRPRREILRLRQLVSSMKFRT